MGELWCSICLDTIGSFTEGSKKKPEELFYTPCNHTFHRDCLFTWFRTGTPGNCCPVCKRQLHLDEATLQVVGSSEIIRENIRLLFDRIQHEIDDSVNSELERYEEEQETQTEFSQWYDAESGWEHLGPFSNLQLGSVNAGNVNQVESESGTIRGNFAQVDLSNGIGTGRTDIQLEDENQNAGRHELNQDAVGEQILQSEREAVFGERNIDDELTNSVNELQRQLAELL